MINETDIERAQKDLAKLLDTFITIYRKDRFVAIEKVKIEYLKGYRTNKSDGILVHEFDCVVYAQSNSNLKINDRFTVNDQVYVVKAVNPNRTIGLTAFAVCIE